LYFLNHQKANRPILPSLLFGPFLTDPINHLTW
jgi:hypothetical protein